MPDKEANGDTANGPAMELPMLKRLLTRSRRTSVGVAIGQGDAKSGGRGLLLLDHIAPPKQILKTLKAKFPTASKLCFGTASVDTATDPKLITLQLNRRAPGLDRRLRKTLKGTGYSRIAIKVGKPEAT